MLMISSRAKMLPKPQASRVPMDVPFMNNFR
jgi:hypothetical protein